MVTVDVKGAKVQEADGLRFCGTAVGGEQLRLIQEVVASCGLSRAELAATVCELLGWERPNGKLKTIECLGFLEQAEAAGMIELPALRAGGSRARRSRGRLAAAEVETPPRVAGSVRDVSPVRLEQVETAEQRVRWKELVARHHYLGHKVPFGAQLRYLVRLSRPEPALAGCLQFSSPAWRVQAREQWIGWNNEQRRRHLQRVVQNSRFLILPWIEVRGLASHVLSQAARVLPPDWEGAYGVRPVLLETFVDQGRYRGTCYRAANWVCVGQTEGRGRMDRHKRFAEPVKTVWVYPLEKHCRAILLGQEADR